MSYEYIYKSLQMLPISIVIITKNEAKVIAKCIAACLKITDNIIIIDNGSTDDTTKIAENLGCLCFQETWDGYGANKNKGAVYAKYDWILSVDADEIPNDEFIKALKETDLSNGKLVFDIKFKSYLGNQLIRFGNWGNDHRIRLFHRKYVKWSTTKVHEKLIFPKQVKIKRIKGYYDHYTANDGVECYQKALYYAGLSADQILINNKKISFFKFYFAPAFAFFRNYIIRLGFLDGSAGWFISISIYQNTRLKYGQQNAIGNIKIAKTNPYQLEVFDMTYSQIEK